MKNVLILLIVYFNLFYFSIAQTNENNTLKYKNHSNSIKDIVTDEKSINNSFFPVHIPQQENIEKMNINVAESSYNYIILQQCINNISNDKDILRLRCCESSALYQMFQDKLLSDDYFQQVVVKKTNLF